MRKINSSHILAILALLLLAVCAMSVCSPMRFDGEREARERAVKQRLLRIRAAEECYRNRHGVYAADFKTLVGGGLLADSLQFIPFAEGRRFELTTTTITGRSGRHVPLMECGAKFNDYLLGLDENRIADLIERAENAGRYPGLKIGDISTPNDNAGNWE